MHSGSVKYLIPKITVANNLWGEVDSELIDQQIQLRDNQQRHVQN